MQYKTAKNEGENAHQPQNIEEEQELDTLKDAAQCKLSLKKTISEYLQ